MINFTLRVVVPEAGRRQVASCCGCGTSRHALASVAGTPQAQEALIQNSIPQTAAVPRMNRPKYS